MKEYNASQKGLEDAQKRASSTVVMTGGLNDPQNKGIAAVSAFKCYDAASSVAEPMWVFLNFKRDMSTEATRTRQKRKEKKS